MSIGRIQGLMRRPGFHPFLWMQFLGALNDNLFKMILSLLAVGSAVFPSEADQDLSLIGAIFILPFFFFSGYAGHLADRWSKRSVLVLTKAFEVVVMGLALLAFAVGRFDALLAVLFLMALQSTFFSPAKYGILPEFLPDRDLSRANGLLEMSTFLAIILGTSLGGFLFTVWKDQLIGIGLILIGIAVAGSLTSLRIPRVESKGVQRSLRWNPWSEIGMGVRRLYRDKTLWLTVIGISYFWFLGALLQMNLILFGREIMVLSDVGIALLVTFLAIGIGMGSLLAGRLSGDKVELGLVPLGSIGMGVFSILLSLSGLSFPWAASCLVFLGLSAGLFIVPLHAFLQQRSGEGERGRLIATNNVINTGGILLASGVLWLLGHRLGIPPDAILWIFGLLTLAATVFVLKILPDFLIRFTLWMLTHTIYRIRIVGQEHVPFRGPALLISNHLSHVDGLLIGACLQRFIRFMIYKPYYEIPVLHRFFRLMKAIPVAAGNRKEVAESLERAREELRRGHVVCIFAEGSISRTGNLLPFKRGFERILQGTDVPVIPVHLDRLWGSIFSFQRGKFFWKWPRRFPYPMTVTFGRPLPSTVKAAEARLAIQEMGSEAVVYRRDHRDTIPQRFIEIAKRRWFAFCIADSSGKAMSYGKTLVGGFLLSRWVRKTCADAPMVGIFLPASVGGAVANLAVLLAGKTPVNLNFTAGQEAVDQAVRQCGIRTIFTSRTFLAKAKLPEREGMVFLEEIMKGVPSLRKAMTVLMAFLCPAWLLRARCRRNGGCPDDLATVIFSSGSTGVPKGVMLSHHNILSNVEGFSQVFGVTERDRIMGVLPFFHSFGFAGTLWFPLLTGFGAVYHPNPMDAKGIGEMVFKHKATILISTPTFYSAYVRKCSQSELASLRLAVVGAEKLREPVARAFKEKFGLDLLEGYGCTEMSPVVSVNVPDVLHGAIHQIGSKAGTVGHPIPGVSAKVIDPDTGAPLPVGREGLLLVKGPNRMLGYLDSEEKTQEVLREGWYVTGDIARIDEDGFIQITDRLSRFSKIGGEMVPHIKVEEVLHALLGDSGCVVSGVPDAQKGERLVVLYTQKEISSENLWKGLCDSDLPKLWIPKPENFYWVESVPTLGTGKTDLKKVKMMAMEKAESNVYQKPLEKQM